MQQLFLLLPERERLCEQIPSLAASTVATDAPHAWAKLLGCPALSKSVLVALAREQMAPGEVALLCEFVQLQEQGLQIVDSLLLEQSQTLLDAWSKRLDVPSRIMAHPSGHHLVILPSGPFTPETRLFSVDTLSADLSDSYPRGPGSELLHTWMNLSMEVFAEHSQHAVTNLWFSSIGQLPAWDRSTWAYAEQTGEFLVLSEWQRGLANWLGWQGTEYQANDLEQISDFLLTQERTTQVFAAQLPPPTETEEPTVWAQTVEALLTQAKQRFPAGLSIGWYENDTYCW